MEIVDAVKALAALAQNTRLSIYRLLVQAGRDGVSAGRIGAILEIPSATLSFHLKELVGAGLVSGRPQKQFIYYAVDFERMAELMTFLTQNCCQGMPETCLSAVESALGKCVAFPSQRKRKGGEQKKRSRTAHLR